MAQPLVYAPQDAVAGDPAALRRTAQTLATLGTEVSRLAGDAGTDLGRTAGYWSGTAGDAYRTRMGAGLAPYRVVVDDVTTVIGRACEALASALETAQTQLRSAMAGAAGLGVPATLVIGALGWGTANGQAGAIAHSQYSDYWVRPADPRALAAYLQQRGITPAHLQPVIDQAALAFKTAREARRAFVGPVGGAREDLARLHRREPTAAELAKDREVGAGRDGNFWTFLQWLRTNPDPEGRVMLYRWTEPYGEPAIFYRDGSDMSNYLKNDATLRGRLDQHLRDLATAAVTSGGAPYDQRTNMTIANGWGTGHQNLHGTEATVGDFHIEGTPTVRPLPGGGHEVVLDTTFTWNDIIDPNLNYLEDSVGDRLIGGTPYNIHIEWRERTTVTLDPAGVPIAVHGYPATAPTP